MPDAPNPTVTGPDGQSGITPGDAVQTPESTGDAYGYCLSYDDMIQAPEPEQLSWF